ncbi:Glyoxalase/Bleomycin resistance protein/Dihydroxybiphenyl dioxygenase [Lipomyces starkeyi]
MSSSKSRGPQNTMEPQPQIAEKMPEHLAEKILRFHSITFACANSKYMAEYHTSRMGFRPIARREMNKNANRGVRADVVKNGNCVLAFIAPIAPIDNKAIVMSEADREEAERVVNHIARHGDSVMDVAFVCDDVTEVFAWAVNHGAHAILKPTMFEDNYGSAVIATVTAFGHVTHTFIKKDKYLGAYLPGYVPVDYNDPINTVYDSVPLMEIDHVVGNQYSGQMENVCNFYRKAFGFHQFVSEDDYNVQTEFSALKSTVMANPNNCIKMPINEPAKGKRLSQIEEYLRYNNGPGVQHIALRTPDIIKCVEEMKRRGVEFIAVPREYYTDLRERLTRSDAPRIKEDLSKIEDLGILVDYDKDGYLLQLFVKEHVSNRPTSFYEIIQREGSEGFGGGNFKALFEAVEREQLKRGNLA